jgi:hypothetical protein
MDCKLLIPRHHAVLSTHNMYQSDQGGNPYLVEMPNGFPVLEVTVQTDRMFAGRVTCPDPNCDLMTGAISESGEISMVVVQWQRLQCTRRQAFHQWRFAGHHRTTESCWFGGQCLYNAVHGAKIHSTRLGHQPAVDSNRDLPMVHPKRESAGFVPIAP